MHGAGAGGESLPLLRRLSFCERNGNGVCRVCAADMHGAGRALIALLR